MEHRKLHIFYHSNSSVIEKTERLSRALEIGDTVNLDSDFYRVVHVHTHFDYDSLTEKYLYRIEKIVDTDQIDWLYQLTI